MTQEFWNYPVTQGFGPTNEKLDSGYGGYANFNKGIDFSTPPNTPIRIPVGGTVISAGDSGDGWGISVKIRDAEGNTHNYGHLNGVSVKPGDKVDVGDLVGRSGNTGKSTGPHLSYDVWKPNGEFFDPSAYLKAQAPPAPPPAPPPPAAAPPPAPARDIAPAFQAAPAAGGEPMPPPRFPEMQVPDILKNRTPAQGGAVDEFGFPITPQGGTAPSPGPVPAAPAVEPPAGAQQIPLPGGGFMVWVPEVDKFAIFTRKPDPITGVLSEQPVFAGFQDNPTAPKTAAEQAKNIRVNSTTGKAYVVDNQGNIVRPAPEFDEKPSGTKATPQSPGMAALAAIGSIGKPSGTPSTIPGADSLPAPAGASLTNPNEDMPIWSGPDRYTGKRELTGYLGREIGRDDELGVSGGRMTIQGGGKVSTGGFTNEALRNAGIMPTGDFQKDLEAAAAVETKRAIGLQSGLSPLEVQSQFDAVNLGTSDAERRRSLAAMDTALQQNFRGPPGTKSPMTIAELSRFLLPEEDEYGGFYQATGGRNVAGVPNTALPGMQRDPSQAWRVRPDLHKLDESLPWRSTTTGDLIDFNYLQSGTTGQSGVPFPSPENPAMPNPGAAGVSYMRTPPGMMPAGPGGGPDVNYPLGMGTSPMEEALRRRRRNFFQAEGGSNVAGLEDEEQRRNKGYFPGGIGNGFTTNEPVAMMGMQSGRPLAIAGEAGPEAINVEPLGPRPEFGMDAEEVTRQRQSEGFGRYGSMMPSPAPTRQERFYMDPVIASRSQMGPNPWYGARSSVSRDMAYTPGAQFNMGKAENLAQQILGYSTANTGGAMSQLINRLMERPDMYENVPGFAPGYGQTARFANGGTVVVAPPRFEVLPGLGAKTDMASRIGRSALPGMVA